MTNVWTHQDTDVAVDPCVRRMSERNFDGMRILSSEIPDGER